MKNCFLFKVFVLGVLGFCFSNWAQAESRALRIAIIQEWADFNPVTFNLASTEALMPFVYRGMVARGAGGEVLPDVAEAIPNRSAKTIKTQTINGKEKVIATWQIRDSAKWGDGKPILCTDWELGRVVGSDIHVMTQARSNYAKVEKITWDPAKPKTCHVTYKSGDWTFDRDLPGLLPRHIEGAVYEKMKGTNEAYDRNSVYVKAPGTAGLYSGPYVISEFKLGSHFIMQRNPYFYGLTPQIDKIIVSLTSDTSALRAQLAAGQIDMVAPVGFPLDVALSLDAATKVDGKTAEKFRVRFQNSPVFQGLFFNMEDPILTDLSVRKAISMAIDKELLVKAFFGQKISSAQSFLPERHPRFQNRDNIFSRAKAAEVLDQAGWKMGSQAVRERNGRPLRIVFKTSAGIKIYENIQVFICDQLKQVGIGCQIKNEPPRVLLGESVPHGDFAVAMFGQPILPDSTLSSIFSSEEIPSSANSYAGGNISRWKNKDLDQLIKSFDAEWGADRRGQIVSNIEKKYLEDIPFVPLYHRREAMIVPLGLEGLQDDFQGTGLVFPEKWKWVNSTK